MCGIHGEAYFRITGREEDKNNGCAKDKLVPVQRYFNSLQEQQEWYLRHEEKALSEFYGARIRAQKK